MRANTLAIAALVLSACAMGDRGYGPEPMGIQQANACDRWDGSGKAQVRRGATEDEAICGNGAPTRVHERDDGWKVLIWDYDGAYWTATINPEGEVVSADRTGNY